MVNVCTCTFTDILGDSRLGIISKNWRTGARLAAVIEAVARLAAVIEWAWKAEIERHYRTDPTVGIIVCGFHRNVDIIAEIRWWALSDCGHHYRKVQSVLVASTIARLAMVVNCGHFPIRSARAVFAGPLS